MKNLRVLIIVPSLGLALSGCLGETNQRLDGIESSTKILATEVQADREYLKTSAAAIEKAANKTDELSAKLDTMNGNLGTINGNLGAVNGNLGKVTGSLETVNGSLGTVADSVKKIPGALDQVVESTQAVSKSAAASEEQLKRVGDNLGVMTTYAGVALTVGKEYMDQQAAKASAPTQVAPPTVTAAPGVAPPAPAARAAPAAPSEAELDKVDTSLLSAISPSGK